jgi:hypothetical protein
VTLGSRLAFAAWRLYRTSSLARRVLDPRLKRSAERRLAALEEFVEASLPSEESSRPRPTPGARLKVNPDGLEPRARARLFAVLNHWRAKYDVSPTGAVALDPRLLSPNALASPKGPALSREIDAALGAKDWREPLPPLVSARVDDVTGAGGLGWLAAFEEQGIRPSIGTLHDEWLDAGKPAIEGIVAASRRGCSVSPHAFSMERFIWFDAPRGCPFSEPRIQAHAAQLAADAKATGLVFGQTLNAHFDVIGSTAVAAAHGLGFRYALGEHALDQDWREPPRARDPLGTPLYAYGPLDSSGKIFGFQAAGAIASSAAPRSRYDWLRNFIEIDASTGKPIRESLDRAGAVKQGVTQLLSALDAGFPAYLLAHEIHLDALGRELVGELLSDVLREVRARVPEMRVSAFDELPAACAARFG